MSKYVLIEKATGRVVKPGETVVVKLDISSIPSGSIRFSELRGVYQYVRFKDRVYMEQTDIEIKYKRCGSTERRQFVGHYTAIVDESNPDYQIVTVPSNT